MRPQILDLGFFTINGYGLMIGIAIPLCFWLVTREARRQGLESLDQNMLWLFFWIAGSVYLGGKLAYVIGYPESFRELEARAGMSGVLSEGFVFFGSVILAVPVTWFALRRHGIPPGRGIDILILIVPLGHAFGRMGCFLAGCCYGCRTDGPLQVCFPTSYPGNPDGHPIGGIPVHPVQLYEAGGSLLIFAFMFWWLRPRRSFDWQLLLTYLVLYAVLRLITETFRGDGNPVYVGDDSRHASGDAPGGLTQAQVISLLMLVFIGPVLWSKWRAAARSGGKA